MMNLVKKLKLAVLSLVAVAVASVAHATAPTAGTFGGAVDFGAATTDVTYVGYAVLTFSLVMIGFWIIYRMTHSAKRA